MKMKNNLSHLSSWVVNTPLLCTQNHAEIVASVIGNRMGINPEGLSQSTQGRRQGVEDLMGRGTMVIPIIGSLSHRETGMEALSGMASYAGLQKSLQSAVDDPQVKSILLDIDSPGGMVSGAFDFADYLKDLRGSKPIHAISRDTMASAAYLIGSSADKIYTTQTGSLGSIGVVAMHLDRSEANEKEGVKPTFIYAGDHKVDGNPHAPLGDSALKELQESVNDSYEMFVTAVADSRGISTDAVRNTQARMYRGSKAIKAGLADSLASFDVALDELATSAPRVYQSMSIQSNTTKENEGNMTPEEIAALEQANQNMTSENEKLKASILAAGFTITAEGLTKAPEKEFLEVGGELVDKATLPESVVKALVSAQSDRMDADLSAKAAEHLPNHDPKVAKTLLASIGDNAEALASLKASDALMGNMMEEVGESNAPANMMSAKDKWDSLIKGAMESDSGLTKESAVAKVYGTKEGIEQYKLMKKEAK